MKTRIDWNEEPELFDVVAEALEAFEYNGDGEYSVWASGVALGCAGEIGVVKITFRGQRFGLELSKLH